MLRDVWFANPAVPRHLQRPFETPGANGLQKHRRRSEIDGRVAVTMENVVDNADVKTRVVADQPETRVQFPQRFHELADVLLDVFGGGETPDAFSDQIAVELVGDGIGFPKIRGRVRGNTFPYSC
eukprot:CAMPEP_0175132826 /NCGR_PEP_ID=MMETSP0087-20121206/7287_1 /TAXON_ID=136419 /ORGANISM="Unknown Unknown, Strain D1" /LENGTH=124 /DNA_ID=CAMNT_0016415217 /DNA_START=175 /DNA_END=549 /DNA_ORIENTATION=+